MCIRDRQNHSGARSMRRWNARVESGSNLSSVLGVSAEWGTIVTIVSLLIRNVPNKVLTFGFDSYLIWQQFKGLPPASKGFRKMEGET